jgi:hypothetical protein
LSELRAIIDNASSAVESIFAVDGELMPMWHLVTADGEYIMASPGGMEKDLATEAIRAIIKEKNIVRYIFIDEAWVVQSTVKDEALKKIMDEGSSLAEHPGRREFVIFCAEERNGGFILGRREILREQDKPPTLGQIEFADEGEFSGRFVGMFDSQSDIHS